VSDKPAANVVFLIQRFWQSLTGGKVCHKLLVVANKESAYGNHEYLATE
jgi:hypothetical protein